MEKQAKNIHLERSVIDALTIQAIKKGFKNFKNYTEHLLIEQSKEKAK